MKTIISQVHQPITWRIVIAAVLALLIFRSIDWPSGSQLPAALAQPSTHNTGIPQRPVDSAPVPPLPEHNTGQTDPETARQINAQMAFSHEPLIAALPFRYAGTSTDRARAVDCLALASWYEAGDDTSGQRAVIQVILNRVRHPAFPNTICGVVFQGSERTTGCQFTFTCDGALSRRPSVQALARSRILAEGALAGLVDVRVGLSTQYHAEYVVPYWQKDFLKIAQEGLHIFYRWPGYWGSPKAMSRQTQTAPEPMIAALAGISMAHTSSPREVEEQAQAEALETDDPDLQQPLFPATPTRLRLSHERLAHERLGTWGADVIEMQLDENAPSGSFALKALALCQDLPECRVAGKVQTELAFVYVRKGSSQREGLYWDCARFQRSDPAQCLPQGPSKNHVLASL